MKKTIVTFAILTFTNAVSAEEANCALSYRNGITPVITNTKLAQSTKSLCFSEFAVMHSRLSRTPLWSAEHLTAERIRRARALERRNAFHEEPQLRPDERSYLKDYARSKLDKGHVAPSRDMSTYESQYESFSLANIVPQNPNSNRDLWERIEIAVRNFAIRRGDLYVVSGPLFSGEKPTQLHGRVLVPTRLFKIVFDTRAGKGAAYVVNNAENSNYSVVSIADLEQVAGVSFFPDLSQQVKNTKLALPPPVSDDEMTTTNDRSAVKATLRTVKALIHHMSH